MKQIKRNFLEGEGPTLITPRECHFSPKESYDQKNMINGTKGNFWKYVVVSSTFIKLSKTFDVPESTFVHHF